MPARLPSRHAQLPAPTEAVLDLSLISAVSIIRDIAPDPLQIYGHGGQEPRAATPLPTPTRFCQALQRMMTYSQHDLRHLALICIDLDNFREVNDNHGQEAGDRLLVMVVERLRHNLRDTDLLARLDNDRFVVASPLPEGRLLPRLLGDRLRGLFDEPFEAGGLCLEVRASLGIAIHSGIATTAEKLLHDATLAMHQAKAEGGNILRFFRSELRQRAEHVYKTVSRLRRAVERGHLEVHYQLQFELNETHRPSGLEALLRWRDGDAGLVPPERFLPLAAEYGLMPVINRWLVRQACRDNRTLIDAGLLDVPVAINICADTLLRDDFLASVRQALEESGLPGERLEVEIVESTALHDLNQAARSIGALKQLGVKMAMDDFGTGYSSPALLKSLPFDRIKIDRCFIAMLPDSPVDQAIVQGILSMARSAGMQVVAEGIEHPAQLDYLRQRGCAFGQGFWYARPLPLAELHQYLTAAASPLP